MSPVLLTIRGAWRLRLAGRGAALLLAASADVPEPAPASRLDALVALAGLAGRR